MREVVERVRQINRDNQQLLQQLIESEQRFRRLAKAVWKVQEEERRRLARELHDGLGQNLTALKNELEMLERQVGGEGGDGAAAAAARGESGAGGEGVADGRGLRVRLAGAAELAGRLLYETRELSRLLRPAILDDLGLGPALRWLARTLREGPGLQVQLACDGLEGRLDPDLETLIFRVAQEALTNVLKHSGVSAASLELRRSGSLLALRVSDAGAGFEPAVVLGSAASESGSGLRGIRDRVELFGGRCRVLAAPGQGTTLKVEVPLARAASPAGGSG
ncbi:MAG TPA: ATP-binding protein [Thermoanaerobaculia bacterium]|nr:ATP-binding protein [Thermoanaerobaculia bacterium]